MKPVCILKFGGNTLANKQKLLMAAQLIKARYEAGFLPVIVASANGNLTDVLLDHAYSISRNPDKRELDMLITTGERVSVALLSIALRDIGVPSVSLTGSQIGLITTCAHTGADILTLKGARLKKELDAGNVPVVAGFQGIGENKEITTLKRGGSDVSAVFLASQLGADHVEMIKDVDGVNSADPNKDQKAQKYEVLDFDEMYKLALNGASVLHPDAVRLAKEKGVEIRIVHYQTGQTGTVIK
ncbi:MAG: aspartate kinase [Elusimicrobiaceae bacterium]|nr:aspartate kinase [Elusimicrobiaceae bacterium]